MQHKRSDYRLMEAMCREVASQMSLESDRDRLAEVARKWRELADASEPEKLSDAPALCTTEPLPSDPHPAAPVDSHPHICTTEPLRSDPHPEDAAPVDNHPHIEEQRSSVSKDPGWLLRMRAAVFKGSPRS